MTKADKIRVIIQNVKHLADQKVFDQKKGKMVSREKPDIVELLIDLSFMDDQDLDKIYNLL